MSRSRDHDWERDFDLLRSGFLKDGRYYSIEALPRGLGRWMARLVCVPGDSEQPIRNFTYKRELVDWVESLSPDEIERLAERHLS